MEIVCKDIPWEETLLAPIGDLQLGAMGARPEKLKRHIDFVMHHPNPWWIGMGDYTDFLSPSNRTRLNNSNLYDDAANIIEEKALELADRFLELFKGTEGRWLGLLEGHHFYQLEAGYTTDQHIARKLGARFLGTSAFVGMQYHRGKSNSSNTYSIACHHGQGGGTTAGAPLNKLQNWMKGLRDVDLVLIGHYTQLPSDMKETIGPVWTKTPHIKARPIRFACTGGWYAGYQQGSTIGGIPRGGYPEKGMMTPVAMGAPVYYIRPMHSNATDWFDVKEMK